MLNRATCWLSSHYQKRRKKGSRWKWLRTSKRPQRRLAQHLNPEWTWTMMGIGFSFSGWGSIFELHAMSNATRYCKFNKAWIACQFFNFMIRNNKSRSLSSLVYPSSLTKVWSDCCAYFEKIFASSEILTEIQADCTHLSLSVSFPDWFLTSFQLLLLRAHFMMVRTHECMELFIEHRKQVFKFTHTFLKWHPWVFQFRNTFLSRHLLTRIWFLGNLFVVYYEM